MKEPVILYSIPTCSDCNHAKRFFNEHHIAYKDYNCEENAQYEEEVWKLTGKKVVPTILIDDKVFVGFAENLHEIRALLS